MSYKELDNKLVAVLKIVSGTETPLACAILANGIAQIWSQSLIELKLDAEGSFVDLDKIFDVLKGEVRRQVSKARKNDVEFEVHQ